jgi:hypothetical protein
MAPPTTTEPSAPFLPCYKILTTFHFFLMLAAPWLTAQIRRDVVLSVYVDAIHRAQGLHRTSTCHTTHDDDEPTSPLATTVDEPGSCITTEYSPLFLLPYYFSYYTTKSLLHFTFIIFLCFPLCFYFAFAYFSLSSLFLVTGYLS